MRRKLLVGLVILATIAQSNLQSQEPPSGVEQLQGLTGNWEKKWTVFKSETVPKDLVFYGTHTSELVLNNQHLQEKGTDSDGSSYISFISYIPENKRYQLSVFRSTGETWQMTGDWDAKSKTLRLSRNESDGGRTEIAYQLVKQDEFKLTVVTKTKNDKQVFRLEGTGKRIVAKK